MSGVSMQVLYLHAPALAAKVKGVIAIAPDILAQGTFLDIDFDFGWIVVSPSDSVATAEGALAFVNFGRYAWCGHRDSATMAGGYDWGITGLTGHLCVLGNV